MPILTLWPPLLATVRKDPMTAKKDGRWDGSFDENGLPVGVTPVEPKNGGNPRVINAAFPVVALPLLGHWAILRTKALQPYGSSLVR